MPPQKTRQFKRGAGVEEKYAFPDLTIDKNEISLKSNVVVKSINYGWGGKEGKVISIEGGIARVQIEEFIVIMPLAQLQLNKNKAVS